MDIVKLPKILINKLVESENFLEEIENSDLIENKIIKNIDNENIEFYDIKFENTVFNTTNIIKFILKFIPNCK